jgi:hypothetical protein
MKMVIRLHVDQGPYEDEVHHYLRLIHYALAYPPQPGIEEDMVKAFLVRELKYTHADLGELGYGSPADEKQGDGFYGLAVCLGSEAILEHYRQHQNVAAAARFAANCFNWRPWERRAIRKHKKVFRKARKEAPAEFWELRWIPLDQFSMLMLPKMRAEGRVPEAASPIKRRRNQSVFVMSCRPSV